MNGFQLYQRFATAGQDAPRDSEAWRYAQLLHYAFHLVGITRLFDLLEQAEATGKQLALVHTHGSTDGPPMPTGVELVDHISTAVSSRTIGTNHQAMEGGSYGWLLS